MIRDWLHECGALINYKDDKIVISHQNNKVELMKSEVEKADIHKSIELFDGLKSELKIY